jgi:hypothetical protein
MTRGPDANPPAWAEAILPLFLKPEDRESVSGDLLEDYRETIQAGGNRLAADRAYVRQAAGFLWRATWMWAVLLALLALGRFALDMFVPPASFHMRSVVTTCLHVAVFVVIGFRAAWRRRSADVDAIQDGLERLSGGVAAAVAAQVMAAVLIYAGTLLFLGFRHDPQTIVAIERSGGFAEMFGLPIVLTGPAILLSLVGGAAGLIVPRPQRRTFRTD